jgi:roadblock/LC7 domain-containing protein
MSSQLKPFLINGEKIWVEVADLRSAGTGEIERTSGAGGVAQELEQADIARVLKAVVAPVREALDNIHPDELGVEVALGIKGEVGIFVAKSEANASLKVTAKWKAADAKR